MPCVDRIAYNEKFDELVDSLVEKMDWYDAAFFFIILLGENVFKQRFPEMYLKDYYSIFGSENEIAGYLERIFNTPKDVFKVPAIKEKFVEVTKKIFDSRWEYVSDSDFIEGFGDMEEEEQKEVLDSYYRWKVNAMEGYDRSFDIYSEGDHVSDIFIHRIFDILGMKNRFGAVARNYEPFFKILDSLCH